MHPTLPTYQIPLVLHITEVHLYLITEQEAELRVHFQSKLSVICHIVPQGIVTTMYLTLFL